MMRHRTIQKRRAVVRELELTVKAGHYMLDAQRKGRLLAKILPKGWKWDRSVPVKHCGDKMVGDELVSTSIVTIRRVECSQ